MNFIFFGSSEFAQIILQSLLENNWRPSLIVTQPPQPKGRKNILSPTPVQITARLNKIPIITPVKLNEKPFIDKIKELAPEFILLTAYGKIIPTELLNLPPFGFLNLHPSLLPKWRGATPIQSVILAGETETGITLFKMDEQIDHGPIIAQKSFSINNPRITSEELSKILAIKGAELIITTVPLWLTNKIIAQQQNESLATYCHKFTKEDEKINWQEDIFYIDRKVRALNPNPGVYTVCQNKIIKIISGEPLLDIDNNIPRGKVIITSNKKMAIKCLNGIYQINIVKPEGKKEMPSEEFLKGNKWIIGQIIN